MLQNQIHTRVLFYSIMLDIFNASLEFAAIFLISIVTNTVTAYVDKLSFLYWML